MHLKMQDSYHTYKLVVIGLNIHEKHFKLQRLQEVGEEDNSV